MITQSDTRLQNLTHWLEAILPAPEFKLIAITNDASFRRYFRVTHANQTMIAMDAPPDKENSHPFVQINQILQSLQINAPKILHADLEQGFLLLTDLGDRLMLSELTSENVEALYQQSFTILQRLQSYPNQQDPVIPLFDSEYMQKELSYFIEWFLQRYLAMSLTPSQHNLLNQTFNLLKHNGQEQPQVLIHRDFHSRNLMLQNNDDLGVLDFQDAMIGPITYDLVSLLKDCYIDWPAPVVETWALDFKTKLAISCTDAQFLRWFHLMGLQRHLKVLGIFARLHLRDGKPAYLQYLPRIYQYAIQVAKQTPELEAFYKFLVEEINPRLRAQL